MITDLFGRALDYLRVSVTDKCNLRCAYCMPAEGVSLVPHRAVLTFEEIERLVGVFASLGVRKVRVTGGEPLVRRGIVDLVGRIVRTRGIESVPMTTNGLLLAQYARSLKDAGLSRLNVSLDTLKEDRFLEITGNPGLQAVLAGLRAGRAAGFDRIKINAVLIRGFNDDELFDFADLADECDFDVRFIEYMPFGGTTWERGKFMPASEAVARLKEKFPLEPIEKRSSSDPAYAFRIPGRKGSIGFIASVSESFCQSCTRLRLTAEGRLIPCLHADVSLDLREPMRKGATDEELAALIQEGARLKPKAHEDFLKDFSSEAARRRKMISIGG
ncbi:MAG: GTP 3',8-cyclase MoaA [Nitrospirae bacterium]|nr:GTP 3',8-cyclase MoaA [Nitrospirota bacterium]